MLVKKFYIKDIKMFEEDNDKSIIDMLSSLNFSDLISLVSLGNSNCSEKEASVLLDTYLENSTIADALDEIRTTIFGKVSDDNDDAETVDINNYNCLTEVYNKMCFDLMSVGITYSEFWDFSTKDMYHAFEASTMKLENDINNKLSIAYNAAAMIGGAVWGHLPDEAPRVSLTGEENNKMNEIVHTEEYGDITYGELEIITRLQMLR